MTGNRTHRRSPRVYVKAEIQSSREVDTGVYSKALRGGRNNCTMREDKLTAQTDA